MQMHPKEPRKEKKPKPEPIDPHSDPPPGELMDKPNV